MPAAMTPFFLKAEAVRRMPCHLVHSLLEREHPFAARRIFDEPRERPVHADARARRGYVVASEMTPENGARRISFFTSFVRDVVDHPLYSKFCRQQVKERIERP